ncbi:LuxR C-terminal-related transcriptional regulator [Micromonospora sp. NPDC049275]|uniref:LuxR C-terminal-related transcriptional regulator n=1 Tax=Micromonospora sp. NPDC049275 TaxID=3364268 RepID=UPI00371CEB6A
MLFPVTKFAPPRTPAELVNRDRLVAALAGDVLTVPLTLISAPAGYGKTTLVTQLLAALTTLQPIWLSVDDDDNDPRRFLAALAAGFGRHDPAIDRAVTTVLTETSPEDSVRRATTTLINGVSRLSADDVVFVLDEWELIVNPSVQDQFSALVERVPSNVHFVVTTRYRPPLPLARLRLKRLVSERGAEDLRFTRDEVAALLNIHLKLGLSEDAIEQTYLRTEGWPAAVRLLSSAGPDVARRTSAANAELTAFVGEEVFDRQHPAMQRFLIETSVLAHMSARSCAIVTGRDDCSDLLRQVVSRGMFLIQQEEDAAYRYHGLFRDFLGARLARWPAAERAALHRRAAAAERDPIAVARHLLAAGDRSAAADVIETNGMELLQLGRAASLREIFGGLDEQALDRPELMRLAGELAYAAGDLAPARRAFEKAGTDGPVLARLAECRYLQGELVDSDRLLDRALVKTPGPDEQVRLLLIRAQVAQLRRTFDRAEDSLTAALRIVSQGQAIATAVTYLPPSLAYTRGAVDHMEQLVQVARGVLTEGLPRLQVDSLAVVVDAVRGATASVPAEVDRVLADYEQFGGPPPMTAFALAVARLQHGSYTTPELDRVVDDLHRRTSVMSRMTATLRGCAWFLSGRARWLNGQFDAAHAALAQIPVHADEPMTLLTTHRLSLEGLLAYTEGNHRLAESLLRAAVREEDQTRHLTMQVYGSARTRLAWLYEQQGRNEEALSAVNPLLRECAARNAGGVVLSDGAMALPVLTLAAASSPYTAYATALLQRATTKARASVPIPGSAGSITAREAEVLRLLVAGATNREIAERLGVGVETVKTHVRRLLRKLDARSRAGLAARAEALGLLS